MSLLERVQRLIHCDVFPQLFSQLALRIDKMHHLESNVTVLYHVKMSENKLTQQLEALFQHGQFRMKTDLSQSFQFLS